MTIQQRKKDHVQLCTEEDVFYRKTTGFEKYDFLHNALPELNLGDITTKTTLLGRNFDFPLFISSMTGGYTEAGSVNAVIAEFCQNNNLPFGVGSQRVMLENPGERRTFEVVRKKAPDAFIAANIGGAQLIGGLERRQIGLLVESIAADAIIVHLNPLQELVQPEGNHSFRGVEDGIAQLVSGTSLPVIVKETGAGITGEVAHRLLEVGVRVIDVSGSGGTSWSKVENMRIKGSHSGKPGKAHEFSDKSGHETVFDPFEDWGIPTADCIESVRNLKSASHFELIASGGIRSTFDIAKSLALGADFSAAAQPVIAALLHGGRHDLELLYKTWKQQLKTVLFLMGCQSPAELRPEHLRKI